MNFPEWISAGAAIVALVVAGFSAYLLTQMRLAIAELKAEIRQEMDERYVTRREFEYRLKGGGES